MRILAPAGLLLLAVSCACCDEAGAVVAGKLPRANITLRIDDMGITHVIAQSDADALYGAGYAMARDRLTEMEVFRRSAQGRSAELFGRASLAADLGARVIGFASLGAQDEARARAERPDDVALVEAWTAGVNARLAQLRATSAPPCGLSFVPDDWTPAHAYAIGKLLAYGLSNSIDAEILATALRRIAPGFTAQVPLLQPAYDVFTTGATPPAGPAPAPRPPAQPARPGPTPADVPPLLPFLFKGGDSNNWAVDAAHSANGRSLLAGDPHQGLTAPSRFWPVHIRSVDGGGTLDVVGFSFVGTPIVELGHNERVGWTATTNFADVMDLWDIKTDAARTVVHLGDGDHPIVSRTEKILVKDEAGAEQESDYLVEQVPGYGVLLPDAMLPLPHSLLVDGDGILFRWTGMEPTTELSAYLAIDRARSVDDFEKAADMLEVGAVNFVAADAQHIDYHVHSRVPDRGVPGGRTMPWHIVPGSDASLLWNGAILGPDKLPHWRDPARGFLVTGNNDPWGFTADGDVEDDAFYYGAFYANGARAYRIQQQLTALLAQRKATRADLESLQDDDHSVLSDSLRGHLATAVAAIGTDPKLAAYVGRQDLRALASLLAAWDGSMDRTRPEPAVWSGVLWFAAKRAFQGPMSSALFDAVATKSPPYLLGLLRNVLDARFAGAAALVPDGDAAELLVRALDDTSAWLVQRFGTTDPTRFTWGDLNQAAFTSPVGAAVTPPPVAVDGATDTVKVFEAAFLGPGGVPRTTVAPSEVSLYRMVMEFDDTGMPHATLDFALGAQGCAGDPHFVDQQPAWVAGAHAPLAFTPSEMAAHTVRSEILAASTARATP